MYQILKKIAATGIVTEPPPAADEQLRVVQQRLSDCGAALDSPAR